MDGARPTSAGAAGTEEGDAQGGVVAVLAVVQSQPRGEPVGEGEGVALVRAGRPEPAAARRRRGAQLAGAARARLQRHRRGDRGTDAIRVGHGDERRLRHGVIVRGTRRHTVRGTGASGGTAAPRRARPGRRSTARAR